MTLLLGTGKVRRRPHADLDRRYSSSTSTPPFSARNGDALCLASSTRRRRCARPAAGLAATSSTASGRVKRWGTITAGTTPAVCEPNGIFTERQAVGGAQPARQEQSFHRDAEPTHAERAIRRRSVFVPGRILSRMILQSVPLGGALARPDTRPATPIATATRCTLAERAAPSQGHLLTGDGRLAVLIARRRAD